MNPKRQFILILCLTIIVGLISLPRSFNFKFNYFGLNINQEIKRPNLTFNIGDKTYSKSLDIQKGLDLQGGVQLVLEADMSNVDTNDKIQALESVKEVVSRRVDLYGVAEPNIQTAKSGNNYRLIVELPGMQDVQSAVDLIGKTAQLDFRQIPESMKEATPGSVPIFLYETTGLTGKDLKKASVQFNSSNVASGPEVSLQFSAEGGKMFADITQRNLNLPLAIFLDEMPVTAPIVNSHITNGQAVISGNFTIDEANALAIQLNAGALPVPIQIKEQRTIGPSLGQESVQKSITAGLIGLAIVVLFMIGLYGKLGLIADLALIIYGLITLAIYKLVPITLTLPGIAGFILSVGMAVDANILIFERMKEEMRAGRPWRQAMELGFGRAWDSIKDANMTTILASLILLNPFNFEFLVTSGMVRGFALTLLIGVLVSLFTGVVVSRNLIRVLYKGKEE